MLLGIIQTLIGLLGLGHIATKVPNAVVIGFTHGAVLTIGLSQVSIYRMLFRNKIL